MKSTPTPPTVNEVVEDIIANRFSRSHFNKRQSKYPKVLKGATAFMKDTFFAILLISLAVLTVTRNAFAQEFPQWHLPEGATVRLGKGSINEIAYSPDGTRLAVASSIGIWMYDTQTGEALDLLAPNTGVESVSFSPDGEILATGNWDSNVRLWHATTGELLQTIPGHPSRLHFFQAPRNNVVFSPDGNTLAVGSLNNTVFLWNVNVSTGAQLHTFIGHSVVTDTASSISFSPDGKILASSSLGDEWKESVFLWDVNTGDQLREITGHTGSVESISFSPDGSTLATGSGTRVRFWDVNTGETLQTLTGTSSVKSISFSPDGSMLATGGWDGTVLLWDVNAGKTLQELTVHTYDIVSVSFSPDGNTLAAGTGSFVGSGTVLLWDTNTGETLHELTGYHSLRNVSFSPDGNTLAYLRGGNEVQLWDVNTGKLRTFTVSRSIYSVAFSPDGNTLAIGGNWITYLWNANTGAPMHTFRDISCRIESVAISPDGNTLAGGGSDSIVRLWDIKTGTERQIPTGQVGDARVVFSPDGNTLATVPDIGGAVRLWDVNTGKPLRQFTADRSSIYSMAFSPDGNTLVTGSGNYIGGYYIDGYATGKWVGIVTLWEVNTGETLQTLTADTPEFSSISFSPDGSTIATGNRDGTVLLRNINTGETLQTLTGHTRTVSSISFSPDGSTIATGSPDGIVLLWELTPFSPEPERITADINADGTVNVQDLVIVANALGKAEPDLNGDGVVNIQDLVIVANAF